MALATNGTEWHTHYVLHNIGICINIYTLIQYVHVVHWRCIRCSFLNRYKYYYLYFVLIKSLVYSQMFRTIMRVVQFICLGLVYTWRCYVIKPIPFYPLSKSSSYIKNEEPIRNENLNVHVTFHIKWL